MLPAARRRYRLGEFARRFAQCSHRVASTETSASCYRFRWISFESVRRRLKHRRLAAIVDGTLRIRWIQAVPKGLLGCKRSAVQIRSARLSKSCRALSLRTPAVCCDGAALRPNVGQITCIVLESRRRYAVALHRLIATTSPPTGPTFASTARTSGLSGPRS